MTIKAQQKEDIIWTAECPITYVDLYTPRETRFEGQKPQYQCVVLIDKADSDTLTEFKKAVLAASEKLTDTDPEKPFETLLNDGNVRGDRDGNPIEGFTDRWYFTAKSQYKPNLCVLTANGARPAKEGEIRNWDKGQAVVRLRAYDFQGRKGISAHILGFCKTGTTRTQYDAAYNDNLFAHLNGAASSDSQAQIDDLPF